MRIGIVGAGVIGLSTALRLAPKHDVTILADKIGSKSDSRLATAVWHIYLIGGPTEPPAGDRHLHWAEKTLCELMKLARQSDASGIDLVEGVELFRKDSPVQRPAWMRFVETECGLRDLTEQDLAEYQARDQIPGDDDVNKLLASRPFTWGYKLLAPVADMEKYLDWLVEQCAQAGVTIAPPRLLKSLTEIESEFDLLVNASNFGAQQLAHDRWFVPTRGQYFIIDANPKGPLRYIGDDDNPLGMAYSIPRNGKMIVGGSAECQLWDGQRSTFEDPPLDWADVRRRVGIHEPWVRDYADNAQRSDLVVCHRPVRVGGVRLEIERGLCAVPVIHNYGHGASGFSMSWGCADAVVDLVDEIVLGPRSRNDDANRVQGVEFAGPIVALRSKKSWAFADHYEPLSDGPFANEIRECSSIADQCGVEQHPFFAFAANNRHALNVWAAQEAVTTNAFSQMLLACCAHFGNVHARAMFMPVISGEHHRVRDGLAERSHPWLLRKLCESLALDLSKIAPEPCTQRFIQSLATACEHPIRGLGALAVGNERMILREYTAVEDVFRLAAPETEFEDFLESNIAEDIGHSEMLQNIAASIIVTDDEYRAYVDAAKEGVAARMAYYDELYELVRTSSAA